MDFIAKESAQNTIAPLLNGYLLAISALKDDGCYFNCISLGKPGSATELHQALCGMLSLEPSTYLLTDASTDSLLPNGLANWITVRLRVLNPGDGTSIDGRLLDGFIEEIQDELGTSLTWFSLCPTPEATINLSLGAIWSIYVVQAEVGSYAIHCSWDS